MKHTYSPEELKRHYHGGSVLPPLRTVTEMAEEFGVSRGQLVQAIRYSKDAPKARNKQMGTVRNTWYEPNELRRWWKSINESKA